MSLTPRFVASAFAATFVGGLVMITPGARGAETVDELTVLQAQIVAAGRNFERNGFAPSGPFHTGRLEAGASETLEIILPGAKEYMVVGVCGTDCTNLDLFLSNSEGKEIVKDDSDDDVPVLDLNVGGKMTYSLRITMASCKASSCLYGFEVYSKTIGVLRDSPSALLRMR